MSTTSTETWGQMWLPLWPLASDDLLHGIYRTSRHNALDRRYIEANPQAMSNLLVVDIDHPDALMRAMWNRQEWQPNAVVENPANGHAHAVWALAEPVTRTEYARRKPVAYAAAVTEGLRRSVDGDKGYSGLMTKNPTHDQWEASWLTDHLYNLDELNEHLTVADFMPPDSWQRTKRKKPVGLGRNCTLFETARTWAYREIRHHWGDPSGLVDAISLKAHDLNGQFSEPLPIREAEDIARSISRWIITQSRMWADGPDAYNRRFTDTQRERGRRSAEARWGTAEERERRRLAILEGSK